MVADELVITGQEILHFVAPKGQFLRGQDYEFMSEVGDFVTESGDLTLTKGFIKNGSSRYQADKIIYNAKKGKILADGSVQSEMKNLNAKNRIILTGKKLIGNLNKGYYQFKNKVKGKVMPSYRFKRSIRFETEVMDYLANQSKINLKGDVFLTNGNYKVTSREGEIFLNNQNKKLKYFALYDDIKFVENFKLKDGSRLSRRAFAEKMEGIDLDREVILTGAPRVLQGDDVIRGYKITLRENIDVVEVDDSQSFFKFKQQKK